MEDKEKTDQMGSTEKKPALEVLLENLISKDANIGRESLDELKEKMKFTDLRLRTVETLRSLVIKRPATEKTEQFMKNTLQIIETIVARDNFITEGSELFFFGDSSTTTKLMKFKSPEENYTEFKKSFSELWAEVMKWDKSPSIHKRIVILLPDKIMQHLTKPLHMSDYLLSAFEIGGPMSLLALQGIYMLMLRHNFEVTDFYTRLYSLVQESVFHAKYKARFFAYTNQFLSSTHLPEYVVAAFAKKLARLSLHAPSPCIPMILDLIINLMIQHPGLKKLIHKETGPMTLDEDPFLENEQVPLNSRAIESSLWEIKTLQHHVLRGIANQAKFIEQGLPKVEKDLSGTLELTYEEMFTRESSRKKNQELIAPNHLAPESLMNPIPRFGKHRQLDIDY